MLDLDRVHDNQYLFEKTCLIGEKVSWQVKVFPLRSTSLDIGAHRRMAAPLLRWTRIVFFVSSPAAPATRCKFQRRDRLRFV